jgi:hypothetical protein
MLDGLTLNEHSQIELSKGKFYLKKINNKFLFYRKFLKKNSKNSLIIILFLNIFRKNNKRKIFKINIQII